MTPEEIKRYEFIVTIIAIILISIVGGIITTYAWDSGQAYSEPTIPAETTTSWNATAQPFFDDEPYSPIIYAGGGGAGINESTTTEAYYYTVGGGGGGFSYTSIEYPLQVYPQNLIGVDLK